MATTMQKFSAKEAAVEIGTDARSLRKFIRDQKPVEAVGQGNRYVFTSKQVAALKKAFLAWSSRAGAKSTETKPAGTKSRKRTEKAPVPDLVKLPTTVEDDEIEEIDLEELDEPDDEDLVEIEDEDLDEA